MILAPVSAAALCMALNIYHEARGEPMAGQMAVGVVTLNRAEHDPDQVCSVVFEPHQFSWTLDPSKYGVHNQAAWSQAQAAATVVLEIEAGSLKHLFPKIYEATHFHADYVSPYWAPEMKFLGKIGHHLFYKESL